MLNIRIKEIEIYHPENSVHNDFYVDHFNQKTGKDLTHFIEDVLGKKERYVITDERENTLSMGIEAAKKVLAKANMAAEELDMIMFTTQVPEYVVPTNAILLHNAIGCNESTGTLDLNANCSGMTIGLDQASRYMLSNPHVNKLLLVGSDQLQLLSNPEDAVSYANFGDAACALVLEKVEESDSGFIDSEYLTVSDTVDRVTYPANGLSKTLLQNADARYMQWLPFDGDMSLPYAYKLIENVLQRNGLKAEEINAYCLSQFAVSNVHKIRDRFGLDDSQMFYSGDRYGYTGTSSPLIALYEGVKEGRIKRGDHVLFWTVGGGFQLIAVLMKY